MRIRTSQAVDNKLDELKWLLKFSTKAEVLLLAINLCINENNKELLDVVDNGFEVDTRIIFEDQHDYYDYLIKYFYDVDFIQRNHYNSLIEHGVAILENEIKKSRNKNINLLENLIRR